MIVQDFGVFSFIRRNFPGLHLHASTQMTVTGPEGMRFLEQQGASRVVTARELSLSELAGMHETSPIEIESFIHGALCYSYSGQCLMSSLLGGRSGNRGRCAQPCRLNYQTAKAAESLSAGPHAEPGKWNGSKDLCPLSLKDMCTIDLLPEILQAGVYSLKIEGRMKQPQYTAGVTQIYRKYLDRYSRYGAEACRVEETDRNRLLEIFNRGGSCEGYYRQQNGPEMMAFSNEKKTGTITVELHQAKEKLNGILTLAKGHPVRLEVTCGEASVCVETGEVLEAKNTPMDEARIRQQMEKLGNTEYEWEQLQIRMDDGIFLPVKLLNECRRETIQKLTDEVLSRSRREMPEEKAGKSSVLSENGKGSRPSEKTFYASCETYGQAQAILPAADLTGLYVNYDVMSKLMGEGAAQKKELYLSLPHIVRGAFPEGYLAQAKQWLWEGMKGFLVHDLEGYALLRSAGLSGYCVTDHSLYTWNDEAVSFWRQEGILRNTAPLELNEKELLHRDNRNSEFLVYGYLPVIVSAQCIRKNRYGCTKREGMVWLKDRYDTVFPAVCHCDPWKQAAAGQERGQKLETTTNGRFCYNIIYNSIPYGLPKDKKAVERLGMKAFRLSFTIESPKECRRLLNDFTESYLHDGTPRAYAFTRGHFKRGAE